MIKEITKNPTSVLYSWRECNKCMLRTSVGSSGKLLDHVMKEIRSPKKKESLVLYIVSCTSLDGLVKPSLNVHFYR